jgi:hypothetical protein
MQCTLYAKKYLFRVRKKLPIWRPNVTTVKKIGAALNLDTGIQAYVMVRKTHHKILYKTCSNRLREIPRLSISSWGMKAYIALAVAVVITQLKASGYRLLLFGDSKPQLVTGLKVNGFSP